MFINYFQIRRSVKNILEYFILKKSLKYIFRMFKNLVQCIKKNYKISFDQPQNTVF